MRATDIAKAAVYPLSNANVAIALVVFWLLACLAALAGMMGLWLGFFLMPAIFRYMMILLEARARGRQPEPPGTEYFSWFDNVWSLFPFVIVFMVAWGAYTIYFSLGEVAAWIFVVLFGAVYPAMLGVLAITHSPMQSLNPVALFHFISRCRLSYLVAPAYLVLVTLLSFAGRSLGVFGSLLFDLFLVFSLHAVIGAVIAPQGIIDDVSIPDDWSEDETELAARMEQSRTQILTHAYALISRGNRESGMQHITDWLEKDQDPVAAWGWFFSRMLAWENQRPALFFAQRYIHDLLQYGEKVAALKVIMRCRMVDEQFKPADGDMPAAIAAAQELHNTELTAVLKRL